MPDENTNADSILFALSGAGSHLGAQADPDAALGNYRSSTFFDQVDFTEAGSFTGDITIEEVSGANGLGDGTLTASGASELTWAAPGGSTGPGVAIANGETKIMEDGTDSDAFIKVSRTSAVGMAGSKTVSIIDFFNNLLGMSNVTSAEAAAGVDKYRGFFVVNASASTVEDIQFWRATLGTQRVSAAAQLPGSGAGTIGISSGTFDDWPDSGYCDIEDAAGVLREIVYYTSRTSTVLTVPAAGRGLLGTSAGIGAANDTVVATPGVRIAVEEPSSKTNGFIQTIADENTAPAGTGFTWNNGNKDTNGQAVVGNLLTGEMYGVWLHYEVPAGATAIPDVVNAIRFNYQA